MVYLSYYARDFLNYLWINFKISTIWSLVELKNKQNSEKNLGFGGIQTHDT